jgi:hypothetical protein
VAAAHPTVDFQLGRSEVQLGAWLRETLGQSFYLTPEVWLRNPLCDANLRVDILAAPKREGFPFDLFGIEIKRFECEGGDYVSALAQCEDYRRCVVADFRHKDLCGLQLGAVFLFRGRRQLGVGRYDDSHQVRYGAIRAAGKRNVGEIVLHRWEGLRFEISDNPVWTLSKGTTDTGVAWPKLRRIGNSSRRDAA